MDTIGLRRINLLRCGYALLALGLGTVIWPAMLDPASHWELMDGVVQCMLAALAALAWLGLRHPLRMLPLLLFEIAWKVIWLARVALPAWRGGRLDAGTTSVAAECLVVVLVIAVVPWDFVVRRYVRERGERWRSA